VRWRRHVGDRAGGIAANCERTARLSDVGALAPRGMRGGRHRRPRPNTRHADPEKRTAACRRLRVGASNSSLMLTGPADRGAAYRYRFARNTIGVAVKSEMVFWTLMPGAVTERTTGFL